MLIPSCWSVLQLGCVVAEQQRVSLGKGMHSHHCPLCGEGVYTLILRSHLLCRAGVHTVCLCAGWAFILSLCRVGVHTVSVQGRHSHCLCGEWAFIPLSSVLSEHSHLLSSMRGGCHPLCPLSGYFRGTSERGHCWPATLLSTDPPVLLPSGAAGPAASARS